jgi:hypothetical protein
MASLEIRNARRQLRDPPGRPCVYAVYMYQHVCHLYVLFAYRYVLYACMYVLYACMYVLYACMHACMYDITHELCLHVLYGGIGSVFFLFFFDMGAFFFLYGFF